MSDEAIEQLTERFREAGATDPRASAMSQIEEDDPALACLLFMRTLWPRSINKWRDGTRWLDRYAEKDLTIKAMLDSGVDRNALTKLAASVALDVVMDVLVRLDDGHDVHAPDDSPGWALVETDPEGRITGRKLTELNVFMLGLDPTGNEGRDLL